MDRTYMQILEERTPQKSGFKSSFIQKWSTSFGSKKGLSFNDSNPDSTMLQSDNEMSKFHISLRNELNSVLSESIEGDFANLSKGDFESIATSEVGTGFSFVESLYDEFLELYTNFSGEQDVFNLLLNYEQLCCKGVEEISQMMSKTVTVDLRSKKISSTLQQLQQERNLWRLMRILYQDRLQYDAANEDDMLLDTMGRMSDKQIVEDFFRRNSYVRQCQLIVDWLETSANEDSRSDLFNKFECVLKDSEAMEHSLNDLMTSNFKSAAIEMDPDAIFRDDTYIHETDKENENRLFKYMFLCIRSGKINEAQQLAENFGEPWLAAVLEGWRLHHDENFNTEPVEGSELIPVEGNKYRDLWKAACFNASQMPMVCVHEQALYGCLCGSVRAVLPACRTWEDHVWAHVRSTVDRLTEQEIHALTQQERRVEEMPAAYWDKILDLEEIFQEIEATESLKLESKMVHRVLQKNIIIDRTNNIDSTAGGVIEEMFSWVNDRQLDGHILRCMVHVILFFRVIGRSTKEELCNSVLEAYVKELIRMKKVFLIAPYTATLPKDQQVFWYAKFLEGVTDNEERQKCLQLAEESGLDTAEITKMVVRKIRERDSASMEPETALSAVTNQEDERIISSIDWLIFNPSQRAEAMRQANAMLRIFIAHRKLDAAKMLFKKIPPDSVGVIMEMSNVKAFEEMSADDDNTTREYLCFKSYLDAMESFNNWFHHSIHGKPKEPRPPPRDKVTFKDKVAYEHKLQQYQKDLDRWREVVSTLATTASDCLYNILVFINGGWMVDQRTDGTNDPNRQHQMSHLRKLCIPHIARLLQDVLITDGRFQEAIEVSNTIASEKYQLYKEFTQNDLKQFIKKSLESSFQLLDKNSDPLGYS